MPIRSLSDVREQLRISRGFDAEQVAQAKVGRLVRWFRQEGLDAAVVGVSGGIDSAVVLGLLTRVTAEPDSPLRRVVALSVPIVGLGSTGQDRAAARAELVASSFGAEMWVCPMGLVHAQLIDLLEQASGEAVDPWASGQVLSVERTPVLYGAAALLQSSGSKSVVVGTTNRDEGAYLGFFGKASDGMVDVQPISDLHKSEVVALARLLGVPADVVEATPRGDVWDGRTDVEMIGASYDDVEVVLRLRELGHDPDAVAASITDGEHLRSATAAVEALHQRNAHKYRVGSPAAHLDVLPRGLPGGWLDEPRAPAPSAKPDGLPGSWDPPSVSFDESVFPRVTRRPSVIVADGALTPGDCSRLIEALTGAPRQPVGVTGVVDSMGHGSVRSSAFSEELAAQLWARIRPAVPSVRLLGEFDPSEGHATTTRPGRRSWRAVGLSPLLRFMRYETGGRHLCHYDAAYEYLDGHRTLMSVVIFLTGDGTPELGGSLRFVRDGQESLPVWKRDHSDWAVDTRPEQVIDEVFPQAGRVAVFDHRRCHDVACWAGADDRIVIRADVVFAPIDDGRGLG